MSSDRIEKKLVLKAPRAKVWNAIGDSNEFGKWFKAKLEDPFVAGTTVRGRITSPGFDHVKMELVIEKVEPERLLSFRWHPYAIDPDVDYSSEPTTLVELALEDAPEGTLLTITESGFDRIPLGARMARHDRALLTEQAVEER